jgi:hypothetical protein
MFTVKKEDNNSVRLLNFARQYFKAAEIVFTNDPSLTPPLNQLYFHTIELLFKSFLHSKGVETKPNHNLTKLHQQCLKNGLGGASDLQNIVSLMQSNNTGRYAFRYGTPDSTTEPATNWTREVVAALLKSVEEVVDPTPSKPGPPVKSGLILGKPIPK